MIINYTSGKVNTYYMAMGLVDVYFSGYIEPVTVDGLLTVTFTAVKPFEVTFSTGE